MASLSRCSLRIAGATLALAAIAAAWERLDSVASLPLTANTLPAAPDSLVSSPTVFPALRTEPRHPRESETTASPLRLLAERVRRQADDDEAGLARAYLQARQEIRRDEAASLRSLRRELQRGVDTDRGLKEGFFLVSAFTRNAREAWRALEAAQALSVYADHRATVDPHHETLTPEVKRRRLEAYAAKELRRLLEKGYELPAGAKHAVATEAATRAASEISLDLTLAYIELLTRLDASAEIRDALSRRSERDRKLIGEFLAARELDRP